MSMLKDVEVLHCAETIKGGIASYLRYLLPLQVQSFGSGRVILLVPASQVNELFSPSGVVIEVFDDSGSRLFRAIKLSIKALHLVRLRNPKVLHIHSTFAGAGIRPLLALVSCASRIVYCPHGWAWDRSMSKAGIFLIQTVERFLSRYTDQIVCISEHEHRSALAAGLPSKKLVLVRNAIDLTAPATLSVHAAVWPHTARRILFVGRFDEQKGVDVLIAALALLGDDVHAVMAGAAVLLDGAALKIPSNATCVGWLAPGELETLFLQAQILVIPSRWEGFGLVAAEGMRAGLAVIATAVGGLPEVVENNVTGLIIEPNSPVALANAIRSLNTKKSQHMGEMGRKRVHELFSIERLHKELCLVYGS